MSSLQKSGLGPRQWGCGVVHDTFALSRRRKYGRNRGNLGSGSLIACQFPPASHKALDSLLHRFLPGSASLVFHGACCHVVRSRSALLWRNHTERTHVDRVQVLSMASNRISELPCLMLRRNRGHHFSHGPGCLGQKTYG